MLRPNFSRYTVYDNNRYGHKPKLVMKKD